MTAAPVPWACRTFDLSVAYGARAVLENVSFAVPRGSVMGIVGPNGAGKSTLIKAMLGLVPALSGRAEFFGGTRREAGRRIGYMPQAASVDWDFPTSVFSAVLMGTYGTLGWIRRPGRAERVRAHEALERVGIAELTDRPIGELSGGQRQRVFLARALAQDPELYFMDEPFQGVDERSQEAIMRVLHELRAEGRTIVMVHHDLATVPEYCDRVTLLNRRVVASGTIADAFTAAHLRTAYEAGADDVFLALPGEGR